MIWPCFVCLHASTISWCKPSLLKEIQATWSSGVFLQMYFGVAVDPEPECITVQVPLRQNVRCGSRGSGFTTLYLGPRLMHLSSLMRISGPITSSRLAFRRIWDSLHQTSKQMRRKQVQRLLLHKSIGIPVLWIRIRPDPNFLLGPDSEKNQKIIPDPGSQDPEWIWKKLI